MKKFNNRALFLLVFICYTIKPSFVERLGYYSPQLTRDTLSYQKGLCGATALLASLAYTAPTLDLRKSLALCSAGTCFLANIMTPCPTSLKGLVRLLAHNSGYSSNKSILIFKAHLQEESKGLEESLKRSVTAFLATINSLTDPDTIKQENPNMSKRQIDQKIAEGNEIIDDLIQYPSKIEDHPLFQQKLSEYNQNKIDEIERTVKAMLGIGAFLLYLGKR